MICGLVVMIGFRRRRVGGLLLELLDMEVRCGGLIRFDIIMQASDGCCSELWRSKESLSALK